jgi:hypothetical protein
MRLTHNRYDGFKIIIIKSHLVFVGPSFLGDELEDQLLGLTNLENAFLLVQLEASRSFDGPFSGFLTNVPNHDGLFSDMFHWNLSKVEHIWEIYHGSASDGPDGYDKTLPFSQDIEIVAIVRFSFWGELDDEGDLHARSDP